MKKGASASDSGFTLIEVMAALLIMMVGLLGLLQSVLVALEFDTRNVLREESVLLADEQMNRYREHAFDSAYSSVTNTETVNRQVRGGTRVFSVIKDHRNTGENTRRLRVRVTWDYRGEKLQHEIYTLKSKR